MDQPDILCDVETGEPCVLMLACDLPRGHEGDHHAEYEWPQLPPPPPGHSSMFVPDGYGEMLLHKLAPLFGSPRDDAPTGD